MPRAATLKVPTHRPPTTVGEMLEEEFRKPLRLTQVEFAEKLGIDRVRYGQIARNQRALSDDTARRLAHVLGTSIEFWLNLQHMTRVYEASRSPLPAEIRSLRPIGYVTDTIAIRSPRTSPKLASRKKSKPRK